jgi:hypothetical protein
LEKKILKKKQFCFFVFCKNRLPFLFLVLVFIVDAQFPIGDVARLLTFWVDYSESEHLHKEEDDRIEERPGVSRWGHFDA